MQEQQVQEQPQIRYVPPKVLVGIVGSILAVVGVTSLWGWGLLITTNAPFEQQLLNTRFGDPSARIDESSAQIYWLNAEGEATDLVARPVTVEDSAQPAAILEAAIKRLLAGPGETDFQTTIPQGTTLNNIRVGPEGIYIDLSSEFQEGGGSTSMMGRVGQVLYTATSLNPQAQVWFEIDGEPLEVLGGEGIMIDQPMTRETFDENFGLQDPSAE